MIKIRKYLHRITSKSQNWLFFIVYQLQLVCLLYYYSIPSSSSWLYQISLFSILLEKSKKPAFTQYIVLERKILLNFGLRGCIIFLCYYYRNIMTQCHVHQPPQQQQQQQQHCFTIKEQFQLIFPGKSPPCSTNDATTFNHCSRWRC